MFQSCKDIALQLENINLSYTAQNHNAQNVVHLYQMNQHALSQLPLMSQSGDIAPKLENINLSYTAQDHRSVTILKHFIYR